MAQIRNIISGDIYVVAQTPVYTGGVWECGDQRFVDDGGGYTVVIDPILPTITKTHFLLTFTSSERVKARSLRATDPVLDDFWLILDTADTVNLALPSVQNGIEYTLSAVKAGGLTTLNVSNRKAEILAGTLK